MKAITLQQPWATLIALGEKHFETRGWQTRYRGSLAIHAGKKIDKAACEYPPIKQALEKHGISNYKELPTGVILATVTLVYCHPVPPDHTEEGIEFNKMLKGDEVYFGNYDAGRFAWELADVKVLPESVAAKGKLSLWEWTEK